MLSDSNIKSWFLKEEEKGDTPRFVPGPTLESSGPLVLEAQGKTFNSFEWIKEHKSFLESSLLKHGGILLRNFNIHSVSEFNRIVQSLSPDLLDYVYRSTPRTTLCGKIISLSLLSSLFSFFLIVSLSNLINES